MAATSDSSVTDGSRARGTRREIIAWATYDWANSAYSTILITVLHQYLTKVVFQPTDDWGPTMYAWGISASMMTAAFLSPIVGAMADVNASKRRWLAGTALPGAAGAVMLAAVPAVWTWLVVALFVGVSLCFELSLGVYNGFLPEIADEKQMNRVSALGFGLGYLGGALPLIAALGVVFFGARLGVPGLEGQLRIGIAIMGLWWGLFSLPAVLVLRDRGTRRAERQPLTTTTRKALGEVATTLRHIRQYHILAIFLVGFIFYNEGVQTVLSQSSTFATKAIGFTTNELIIAVLGIQFLALPGAFLVGWLSDRLGQKPTLMGCLALWVVVVAVAFVIQTKWQYWILCGMVAMIMGGTQSVSRAIMGVMTPEARTAQFFGFFNFSGKATSFLGPFLFGTINLYTGSPRLAILSLLVFFLLGGTIVSRIDVEQGRRQALED